MKAVLKSGRLVECEELRREAGSWFKKERVLVAYEHRYVDEEGKVRYINNDVEWVNAEDVFDDKVDNSTQTSDGMVK